MKEKIYISGDIYLKKTIEEQLEEVADLSIEELTGSETRNNGYRDVERFYVLQNVDQKDGVRLLAVARYLFQCKIFNVKNFEEFERKYMKLSDFLKKAKFVGKQLEIADRNEDNTLRKSGTALYMYGDRILVEKKDIITKRDIIEMNIKDSMQEYIFKGLTDQKYDNINKLYSAINKQILEDFQELNKEKGKDNQMQK